MCVFLRRAMKFFRPQSRGGGDRPLAPPPCGSATVNIIDLTDRSVLINFIDRLFHSGGTNFGMGVGAARPEGPRAGDGVLGRGQPALLHQLGVCGSAVSSPSGVRGGAPAAEGFSCILTSEPSHCLSQHLSACCIQFAWLGIRFFCTGIYISISPT